MKLIILGLFLSLSSCSNLNNIEDQTEKNGDSVGFVDIEVKKKTLDNGLRILVSENPLLPISSLYIYYDVGGRYEREGTTGATHFLEHMMFKGTPKNPLGVFDSTIEKHGGSTNAYTTFDSTVYYENLPTDIFSRVLKMEADRMKHLLLDEGSVEKERSVIFEERKYRYENSPRGKLYLNMMQYVFEGTPYGGSVIGEVDDLKALSAKTLKDFHSQFYVPNNATLVVVGDVEASEVFDLSEKFFGPLKKSPDLKKKKAKLDRKNVYKDNNLKNKWIKVHGTSRVPLFMMAFNGEALGEREGFVMDLVASLLGQGESSHFYQKFVKSNRPSLSQIYAANYTLMHNGVFFFGGELLGQQSLNSFRKKMIQEVATACEAINERNLRKAKNQFLVDFYGSIKTNAGLASFIGDREFSYNDYSFYKKELEIYESVTVKEAKKACRKTLDDHVFLSLWNKHPQN